MSKQDKRAGSDGHGGGGWGELSAAAQELERELMRFEELTVGVRKMPLDTQKAIQRAAKTTTETALGQERVDQALGALVRAIAAVRTRHEGNVAALQARGEEIGQRAQQFAALYERFSALGDEGKRINQRVQDAAAAQRDADTPEKVGALVATIAGVEEEMATLVDRAKELGQAASAASITDMAAQADALRQQVAAARNKMGLLRKSLAESAPEPSDADGAPDRPRLRA